MFIDKQESETNEKFLKKGYLISDISNTDLLNIVHDFFISHIKNDLIETRKEKTNLDILNNFHNYLPIKELNNFRLNLINKMNSFKELRKYYYLIAKDILHQIVGNELAMQMRINLSIQIPKDDSSLLPIHADTWSGDSAYEVVVWIPLVDCYDTKSMYILNPSFADEFNTAFQDKKIDDSDALFEFFQDKVEWIKIKFGQVLIFNQSLPHGNIVNQTNETRWSMNCRFKSIFSPYGDKKLGEFFEPITIKPASKIGLNYKHPILSDD